MRKGKIKPTSYNNSIYGRKEKKNINGQFLVRACHMFFSIVKKTILFF